MKRRIAAVLLALCMCIGLLPATALAATAGDDGSLVTLEYENDGIANNYRVNVSVYTDQGEKPVKTFSANDARMANNDMKITVVDSQYEIDHIDFDGVSTAETEWIAPDLRSYSFTCSFVAITADTLNVSVYLRTVQKKPAVEGDVYSERLLDVGLRVYDSQLLKMLHLEGQEVSPATEIASIKWNFYHGIDDAVVDENSINSENDYWDCLALDNYYGWAIPYNVQSLEITYRDNAGANEQTVTIPVGDLCFVRGTIAGQPGYEIRSRNEDLRIVYFYNETDGHVGNNYFPYAIRFVDDGEALGDQMPADPTYQDSLYQFVNWEQNDWDGDGMPFLSTTIVNDDLTVFARKMSSTSGGTEIHISNESNQLFDRVAELFNEESQSDPELSAGDIQKDSVQIVVWDSGNRATDKGGTGDGWIWPDEDWYLVYSTYGLDHIDLTQIDSIDVYFKVAGSDEEHMVTIPEGEYPGDISVRMSGTEHVVDLLVNGPEVLPRPEDPDPDPDPAITGFTKTLVKTVQEATAAGITAENYDYPDPTNDNKVIIPENGSVTLLYAMTVMGNSGASFTVTDEGAKLVKTNFGVTQSDSTFSGIIPANGTITFYVSKQFTAENIDTNGNLTNSATIASDDGVEDEDKETEEETPAEEAHDDLNGDDVTVQVYVDGNPVLNPLGYVTLSRDFEVGESSGWDVRGPNTSGILTCDFDYKNDGYNCVDIKVDITDDSTYILQGIRSYQSHGAHGTSNVINNNDGTYTIDNVTAYSSDPDVVIYLYTKYSVEYYKGSSKLTEGSYTDTSAYIVEETGKLGNTDKDKYPESGGSALMQWKNDTAYKTAIALPVLPAAGADEVITGWFLGSVTGTQYNANTSYDVDETIIKSLSAGDRVIKFYAKVTSTATADIDVTKELTSITRGGSPLTGPFTDETILLENDVLTWTITVTNNGTQAVTGLKLSDTLKAGDDTLTFASFKKGTEDFDIAKDTFDLAEAGTEGDEVTFTATYRVQAADKGKTLSNSATVDEGDGDPTNDPGDETTNPVGYTLTYNANGGTINGSATWSTAVEAGSCILNQVPGYQAPSHAQVDNVDVVLIGWTVTQDSKIYSKTDTVAPVTVGTVIIAGDTTVYAAWGYDVDSDGKADVTETKYTLTYHDNFSNSSATRAYTYVDGETASVLGVMFSHNRYSFDGWNSASNGTGTPYSVNQRVAMTRDLDLYAQWSYNGGGSVTPHDYTLIFVSNGGTEFDDITEDHAFYLNVYDDDEYDTHIPSRSGYRFTGWYRDSTLRNRIDEDNDSFPVTSSTVRVYAGWEETTVPSMLNGDDHYAYIQGYADGSVRPNANITRAQVATIFFRLLDEDVRDDNLTTYNTFPDVDEDYWANTAISTMASLGVINGRNSGLFDPDAYITRAEFAAICARFDDSGVDGITTFTDTVGHWAEDEISRAAALGWIQGYSDGTFRPNQYITRAQAVTMINRVLCRLPETEDDLLTGMNTWTDCHVTDWFYLAIQEATNSHDFVAKDRVYESWTDLNRDPDWSRYE